MKVCDWNDNVRDLDSFCGLGMTPGPLFIMIHIGHSECNEYYSVDIDYSCMHCQAEDVCEEGETLGKDCTCDSFCDGIVKKNEFGDFYCEMLSNLTCPRGYEKRLEDRGFIKEYKCYKLASNASGGSTGSNGSGGGSSGSGSSSGGGGSSGSGSGGGSSGSNSCFENDESKKEEACKSEPFSFSAELDCTKAVLAARGRCEERRGLGIAAGEKGGNCSGGQESEGGVDVRYCYTAQGWGMEYNECTAFWSKCSFGKCKNSQRSMPADDTAVLTQSCKHIPPDEGCSKSCDGKYSNGANNGTPDTQASCEAASMKWVGADNGVGMCHPNDNNNGTGSSGSNGSNSGSNSGASGGGNGNGLTQAQLDESLEKFGQKYKNGTTLTEFEESIKRDYTPSYIKGTVDSELKTARKNVISQINEQCLLCIDGKQPEVAMNTLLDEQKKLLVNLFVVEYSKDCSFITGTIPSSITFRGTTVYLTNAYDENLCFILNLSSISLQVSFLISLLFYFLRAY